MEYFYDFSLIKELKIIHVKIIASQPCLNIFYPSFLQLNKKILRTHHYEESNKPREEQLNDNHICCVDFRI